MDNYQRALLNSFTCSRLQRDAMHRDDSAWILQLLHDARSRFVVMCGECFLFEGDEGESGQGEQVFHDDLFNINAARQVRNNTHKNNHRLHMRPYFLSGTQVRRLVQVTNNKIEMRAVFLGCLDGIAYFAHDANTADIKNSALNSVLSDALATEKDKAPPVHLAKLRESALHMDAEHASLLAYAQAMVYWRRRHRACATCGGALNDDCGGHLLRCTRKHCNAMHFPRLDPAVIMLVHHRDACLLARQPSWPPRRYSVLAGFVEPGESAEQAVIREVREETGLAVYNLRYQASQPWPFPGSLMLGYYACARGRGREIHLHDNELEDARWFTRRQLARDCENGSVLLPSALSISYQLIKNWYHGRVDVSA